MEPQGEEQLERPLEGSGRCFQMYVYVYMQRGHVPPSYREGRRKPAGVAAKTDHPCHHCMCDCQPASESTERRALSPGTCGDAEEIQEAENIRIDTEERKTRPCQIYPERIR